MTYLEPAASCLQVFQVGPTDAGVDIHWRLVTSVDPRYTSRLNLLFLAHAAVPPHLAQNGAAPATGNGIGPSLLFQSWTYLRARVRMTHGS